jgi:hypothetical protein
VVGLDDMDIQQKINENRLKKERERNAFLSEDVEDDKKKGKKFLP